jgi:hypothetical protein
MEMIRERIQRLLLVARLDGIHEPDVFLDNLKPVARIAARGHLHQPDEASELVEELRHQVQFRSRGYRDVHLLVAVDEIILLLGFREPALAAEQCPQVVEVIIAHVLTGGGDRDPLECLADSRQLCTLDWRQAADNQLAPGTGLQQSLVSEGVQSMSDRRLRHPERLGDRPLVEHRAGSQTQPQYLAPQVLICDRG